MYGGPGRESVMGVTGADSADSDPGAGIYDGLMKLLIEDVSQRGV